MKAVLLLTFLAASCVCDRQVDRTGKLMWPFTPFVFTILSSRITIATDIYSCTSILTALCVGKKKRAFILEDDGRITPSTMDSVQHTAAPAVDKVRQRRSFDWYDPYLQPQFDYYYMEPDWNDYLEPAIQPYYDDYPIYSSNNFQKVQVESSLSQEQNPSFRLGLFFSLSTVYSDFYTQTVRSTRTVLVPCSISTSYTSC